MTVAYKSALMLRVRRFKGFWRIYSRNKRGIAGITILVFFIVIALAADFIAPSDPIYAYYVAGDLAMPIWFKSLPGNAKLSENLFAVDQPGFPNPQSIFGPDGKLGTLDDEWNFTTASTQDADISLLYDIRDGNGRIAIRFRRKDPLTLAQRVEANLTRMFFWPYNPPRRTRCNITLFAKGVENVPVRVSVAIKQVGVGGNESYPTSITGEPITSFWSQEIVNSTTTGIKPTIDSYEIELKKKFGGPWSDPAYGIFPEPGNYVYEIRILFNDGKEETLGERLQATIYIDDLNVIQYGKAYGFLGTDQLGRDIFAQFIYGARISLFVGLLSAILSVIVGLTVGLVAGYVGRIVDEVLMRFADMLLVLPSLPLLIVLIAVLGTSIWNLILLIGVLGWMGFARMVRSQTLSLKERPFVEAAKAVGASRFHIIIRHILPNVMSLVYVSLALAVPSAILSEAALSWLGLFDPTVVSWGRMLYEAQRYQGYERWWWVIPPGISIALVSLSFILLGYALDEILNPKLRVRR